MRLLPGWSRAVIFAITMICGGCGGSLYDTPTDFSKGPAMTPVKSKMMEEAKAKYEATRTKTKGKSQGSAKRPSP